MLTQNSSTLYEMIEMFLRLTEACWCFFNGDTKLKQVLLWQLFKGFVKMEFGLKSYMTFLRGHRLDLLELLLAHLGDGAMKRLGLLFQVLCWATSSKKKVHSSMEQVVGKKKVVSHVD